MQRLKPPLEVVLLAQFEAQKVASGMGGTSLPVFTMFVDKEKRQLRGLDAPMPPCA